MGPSTSPLNYGDSHKLMLPKQKYEK